LKQRIAQFLHPGSTKRAAPAVHELRRRVLIDRAAPAFVRIDALRLKDVLSACNMGVDNDRSSRRAAASCVTTERSATE